MTKTEPAGKIAITDYTDYVPYIRDLVGQKRQAGGFSYRIFCQKSGFRSSAYLKWVIDQVRPISLKSAHKFAAGLSLDKQESQYFYLMVNYKEAVDPATKGSCYEQMLSLRQKRAGSFSKDAYEYLSHWYYVAIRELVASPDFHDDPRWLQKKLGGSLTLWEIKNGFETLSRLGLISRGKNGKWEQTARDLLTEQEIKSLAAYNYHGEMLALAEKALAHQPAKVRDYQSLVARLDSVSVAELKKIIDQFQQSVIDYLQGREKTGNGAHSSQELYAFNMQLFPLVTPKKEDV